MKKGAANLPVVDQIPPPPESPTFRLEQISQLEKHARERLDFWLKKKEEVKEAREMYDGAVTTLMETIRKINEPEFEFTSGEGKQSDGEGEDD